MEPPAKSGSLRGLVARFLLFGVLVLVLRFAYVVIVHGEHCDAGDFCFFSPPGGFALAGAGGTAGTKVFVRGGEGTANPAWSSREWRRAVDYYSAIFQDLIVEGFLSTNAKSVCVGARMGQQVLALREIGVPDAVGISKKKYPPLVVSGDLFHQPFGNNTFDFVFTSGGTIELSKRPADLASEIARILKPEGFLVVHTSSAGDQYSRCSLLGLFPGFRLVRNREIDGFDSLPIREAVLQKVPGDGVLGIESKQTGKTSSHGGDSFSGRCSIPDHKLKLLNSAEPLIKEEPLKPWITLKRNVKNIKYLPSIEDISFKSRYVYVDVGARSYGSSIGSWFKKQYPKQNKTFDVYAIEADRTFHAEYASKKGVSLLPYAAWVRNETLSFEINEDPDQKAKVKGRGMGRIQPAGAATALSVTSDVDKIQGFDFSEWLRSTVTETDFVVVKMDVEGTEFELIPRLFETGAICLIDELFLECHYNRWQRCCPGERTPKYQNTYGQCLELFSLLRRSTIRPDPCLSTEEVFAYDFGFHLARGRVIALLMREACPLLPHLVPHHLVSEPLDPIVCCPSRYRIACEENTSSATEASSPLSISSPSTFSPHCSTATVPSSTAPPPYHATPTHLPLVSLFLSLSLFLSPATSPRLLPLPRLCTAHPTAAGSWWAPELRTSLLDHSGTSRYSGSPSSRPPLPRSRPTRRTSAAGHLAPSSRPVPSGAGAATPLLDPSTTAAVLAPADRLPEPSDTSATNSSPHRPAAFASFLLFHPTRRLGKETDQGELKEGRGRLLVGNRSNQ
ncbi:hypothetical protein Taro_022604 [Colocasia esculenta]|uniref:Methyltransferase type 11 domain-containing protein n=1 Tax=Colocasia esculenta TaxID=4460 RepID=A0A843VBW0_COLES|nr:hypothetical protein [Colocasia esculenta]